MFQNEYREVNKYSEFIANFGYVNNYKSSISSNKNSIFSFSNFDLDLNLKILEIMNYLFQLKKFLTIHF